MGSHGVAQLVDAVHAGVDGGIKADGVIGVGQVVVDGAGQTDDVDVALVLDQARAAEAKKDWGTALWQYWRAADIAGKRPEPYLALVRIHLQRNEKESAEKAYRKALQYGAERDASLEEQFK